MAVMTAAERRVLLLWDVDHTLIDNGGVSKANYALAFQLLSGRPATTPARTGGRTDVEIMESLLVDNGEDSDRYPWDRQESALAEAGRRNRPLLEERGRALAGARDTLALISCEDSIVQSVLTGNIEANARVKLAAFGLDDWVDFTVGAFGSESRVRAHLVPVAQRKASAQFGFRTDRDATVLIGDTPRDVQAGLDGGARVVAVATGGVGTDALKAAGADAVLSDLSVPAQVLDAIRRVVALDPVQAVATGPE